MNGKIAIVGVLIALLSLLWDVFSGKADSKPPKAEPVPGGIHVTVNPQITNNPVIHVGSQPLATLPPVATAPALPSPSAAPSPTVSTPALQPSSGAALVPAAKRPTSAKSDNLSGAEKEYLQYLEPRVLQNRSRVNLVAIRGEEDTANEILDVLAVPLTRNGFKAAFFNSGLYRRALNGDGSEIAALGLPREIDKILLLSVGQPVKSELPDVSGALKLSGKLQIALIAANSGAVLKKTTTSVQGLGFNDAALALSLREDMEKKLAPFRSEF